MNKQIDDGYRPTAYITVNKQRIRQYDTEVYLNDKTQFEIELFNPTPNKVFAKIEINGKSISASGIVVKPGQRIFLERFIDVDRKFLYEIYEVNADSETVQKAIAKNGLVKVSFYNEQININWDTSLTPYYYNSFTTYTTNSFDFDNVTLTSSPTTLDYMNDVKPQQYSSKGGLKQMKSFSGRKLSKKQETGTVEKGDKSNQSFSYSNDAFNCFVSWITEWQIKPMSQRPIRTKDLQAKCCKCGYKLKQGWKVCPNCGTVIQPLEDQLENMSKEDLIKMIKNNR